MTIGRQQTEQSSTCCCDSTDRSTEISIASQQYGQVIVSNWIKRRLFSALRLQPLPSPAARLEAVCVARAEAPLVAHALVETIVALDPKLERFEPQPETAPELGARQLVAGFGTEDFRRAFLEDGRIGERSALLA